MSVQVNNGTPGRTRYFLVAITPDRPDYTVGSDLDIRVAGGTATVTEVDVPELAKTLAVTVDGGCGNCASQAAECVDGATGGIGLDAAVMKYLGA